MKKKDILIVVLLFALWMAWPFVDRRLKKFLPAPPPAPPAPAAQAAPPAAPGEAAVAAAPEKPAPEAAPALAAEVPAPAPEPQPALPGQTAVLENDDVKVTVSSRGAAVTAAEFKKKAYRQTVDPDSGPVLLDFSAVKALAYSGLPGLTGSDDFTMEAAPDGRSVAFQRKAVSGLLLRRTISLASGYMLKVDDELVNEGGQAVTVPPHALQAGSMSNLAGEAGTKGIFYLGVDTLSPGGEGMKHWAGKIPSWFDLARKAKGLPKLPVAIEQPLDALDKPVSAVDWMAVKGKYFVQILVPEGGGDRCVVHAAREVPPAELENPDFKPKGASVRHVWASISFPEFAIAAGEKFSRPIQYYVGPKKYSELNQYGMHLVDVMEFGMWAPVGKILLQIMNWIYLWLWPHNYGIAIILLTILVRIVFWPVTHKSTESMKKMQAIQPLVTAVRAKHKDNPQKQQQAIMELYKEHKVNPLGGCLPTLIQIPVFIALFVVLRSAVELRFAPFLWIKDLSQPENLLVGVLPLPLNILPIFMAVTMAWQQKLTPSAGADPNQQKMMMFMPIMMLVMFYNFAAGLVLYWSTNQVLMIAQQLMMQRKKAKAA